MTVNISTEKLFKATQFVLILVIAGLLFWSQPWNNTKSDELRKIAVQGEATIQAEPDEYVFYPYLEKSGTDRNAIREELTQQANTVVDAIKELGVSENKITLDASSYDNWYWRDGEQGNMRVSLSIELNDKDQSQEVQNYLLTLDNLEGQLTPQARFSTEKQKTLEKEATEKAIQDARNKAEQQASLLGAKVGEVLEAGQLSGIEFPVAFSGSRRAEIAELDTSISSLPVLPGENDYTININVTYELR